MGVVGGWVLGGGLGGGRAARLEEAGLDGAVHETAQLWGPCLPARDRHRSSKHLKSFQGLGFLIKMPMQNQLPKMSTSQGNVMQEGAESVTPRHT